MREVTAKGGTVIFLEEKLTFNGRPDDAISNLMLAMLASVAQFERALICERQREGIAKVNGLC